jgi:hypothetical protein
MLSTGNSERRGPSLFASLAALLVLLVLMFGAFLYGRGRADRGLYFAIEQQSKRSEIVATMLKDLYASAGAAKDSVMAETDEESIAFADEARRLSAALESDRQELGRLIQIVSRSKEIARFEEFNQAWEKYRALEREILDLAVENTNLKAQRLSFVPARDALARFEAALDKLVEKASPTSEPATSAAPTVAKASSEALIAALKIHALQAQHIAEPRDAEMDRIEAQMKVLDLQATDCFSTLSTLSNETSQGAVREAQAAYADFQKLNLEILGLSRRNTNVRSLALSLGKQRNATATCRDLLESVRDCIQNEAPKPSRR